MSNTKMKHQKLIKVGNSYAVTIDAEFIKRNSLKVGESMVATYRTDTPGVSFVPSEQQHAVSQEALNDTFRKSALASSITPEFQKWVKDFYEENEEAMEKLANL